MRKNSGPRERKNSGFLKDLSAIQGRHPSIHQHPILKEGYLKKKSSGALARWQERYFTLQGPYLKYYTDVEKCEKDLKGSLDLKNVKGAKLTGVGSGEGLEFTVTSESDEGVSVAYFRARDKEEARDWMDLISDISADPDVTLTNGFGSTPPEAIENLVQLEQVTEVNIVRVLQARFSCEEIYTDIGACVRACVRACVCVCSLTSHFHIHTSSSSHNPLTTRRCFSRIESVQAPHQNCGRLCRACPFV